MCTNGKVLERTAKDGDSPVPVGSIHISSRAEHVKFCLKMGGTPSKPKYSRLTDSELVP
jgi:hypothetical protein